MDNEILSMTMKYYRKGLLTGEGQPSGNTNNQKASTDCHFPMTLQQGQIDHLSHDHYLQQTYRRLEQTNFEAVVHSDQSASSFQG